MTVSDIITMISLIIAIVAIINEKNRKHLLLKFSKIDFIFYAFCFLLINYFVFYNHFVSKGYIIPYLYFNNFGLSNPSYYSYLISISVLILVLFKISSSFYPSHKKKQVLKYYKELIESDEIPMLLDIIEQYHQSDIIKKIDSSKDYDPNPENIIFERFHLITPKEKISHILRLTWERVNKHSKANKFSYADLVLHNIINDLAFIAFASNVRPYVFANIISTFKKEKRSSFPDDLVKHFLTEIINEKNFWLCKEIKQSDNFDKGQPESFFSENKIIASLIQDVSVADVNEIWIPFGEEAIKEIENEKYENSRLNQQYRNDDLLWEFKVFISIKFFNILIIESIVQKYSDSHFFLHYYWHITEKILENIKSSPPNDFEEVESNYHHLINQMNDYLFHWLNLANEHETDRYYDIIACLGNQINCITKNPYFGEERKISLIERMLYYYCNFEEKEETAAIRKKIDEILLKPSILTKPTDTYYDYFNQAWVKFDKIPHIMPPENIAYEYFSNLKNNVIIPLGLNPDAY